MRLYAMLVLLSIYSITSAQQFKLDDVGILKDSKGDRDIIKVSNGFIAIEYSTKTRMAYTFTLSKLRYDSKLIKYDDKLNIQKQIILSGGERVYGPFIPFLKSISNKTLLFYFQSSDNENEIILYASEIDESTLELKTAKKILAINQKNIGVIKAFYLFDNQKLIVNVFPNNQKTIVAWSSGVNNEIYISVLEQNMDLIWSKNEKVAGADEIRLTSACVDKNGTAFISYINTHKKDKKSFIIIAKQNAATANLELVIDGGIIRHAFISPGNSDNDILISGTYMEGTDYLLTGAFSQHINANSLVVSNKLKQPFPESLVEQFKNDSYARTKNKDYGIFANSDLEHAVMEEGSVSISGDFNRYVGSARSSLTSQITGSILHILIKKDTAVFNRIPRSEVEVHQGGESANLFYPFAYKDKMLVFYNDDAYGRGNQLIVAIIDKNGGVNRKALGDAGPKVLALAVEKIRPINDSVLILPTVNDHVGILEITN